MRCTTLALLLLPALLPAQQPKPPVHRPALSATGPATGPATDPATDPATTHLPVTHVSLYKNGVGFFEHTGRISGDATVTIDFTSGQLNDVLQSLTAIDLNGGRISGADYNSTTPLDQQLKNLPLALGSDPTALEFYNAIRGSRVEVHSGTVSITGRLLSMEERTVPAKPDGPDASTGTTRQYLTVVADSGETRTLELTPAASVRLLDTSLHTDVTRYLQLLDANRSQGLRHLTLTDNGTGARELKLSYISEVPIWKSTYRILFTDTSSNTGGPSIASSAMGGVGTTATLQGWSVVDNTTGADWINVQLSLIAGAPQSFIQPLSQPIYSRRPEVPIAQSAQLTPQTFDSSIDDSTELNALASPTKMPRAAAAPMANRAMTAIGVGSGNGIGAGSGGGVFGGVAGGLAVDGRAVTSYEDAVADSIAPNTTTAAFDDFFAYNLTEPVTILKNQSALVPILQAKVTADRVTLVSYANSRVSQPLRALWVTNTSGLTLDRGSFSIVENGSFGGEGLLDPIHAGEKRLLSYAADQAVHVTAEDDKTSNHVTFLRGSKGVLNLHHADLHEVTLVLHNAASAPRTVVSEVPVVNGWKLDSVADAASTDPKPVETTPTVYRYRTVLAPGDTARLHIGSTRTGSTAYRLTNSNDSQFEAILTQSGQNPALIAALQPILDARRKVADAQAAVDQTNKQLTALRSDEDRQRANITALATADKSSRDRFVHDLNATEDAISAAQKELTARTNALDAFKADLASRIDSFQIDTSR